MALAIKNGAPTTRAPEQLIGDALAGNPRGLTADALAEVTNIGAGPLIAGLMSLRKANKVVERDGVYRAASVQPAKPAAPKAQPKIELAPEAPQAEPGIGDILILMAQMRAEIAELKANPPARRKAEAVPPPPVDLLTAPISLPASKEGAEVLERYQHGEEVLAVLRWDYTNKQGKNTPMVGVFSLTQKGEQAVLNGQVFACAAEKAGDPRLSTAIEYCQAAVA